MLVPAPGGDTVCPETDTILKGGWRNLIADPLIRSARLPIVYSWNETVPLHAYHRNNGQGHECTYAPCC